VGLDVHARETAAAVLDPSSGEISTRTFSGRPSGVLDWLQTVPQPFQAVYEAGPTGYGLARAAKTRGLDVVVCAPGHVVRSAVDRVKTDKRDAIRLARLLLAGELHLVRVPEPAEEQLRDLVRAREDLRTDLMRCRARIAKFLLRRELYYPLPGNTWTKRHRNWLRGLRFDDRASELAFADALHAHDSMLARRDQLEAALEEIALGSWAAETVARLRCLRGISTLSATGLTAEVCDFRRFAHPRLLASYLGVVPSEESSGEKRQGPRWSPRGDWILFYDYCDTAVYDYDPTGLFLVSPDGSKKVGITPGQQFDNASFGSYDWSPDGKRIVLTALGGSIGLNFPDIFLLDPATGSFTNLTNTQPPAGESQVGPWVEQSVAFSPDGTEIAFARNGEIWLMNADGSHERRLTTNTWADDGPSWQPCRPGVTVACALVPLRVTKAGSGRGTITSSPPNAINCGKSCKAGFLKGTRVTLIATPVAGSVFAGWKGACKGTRGCNLLLSAAASVTARFDRRR
jgi:transposase